jgi:hypothetical protein
MDNNIYRAVHNLALRSAGLDLSLTKGEAMLILDALNGLWIEPNDMLGKCLRADVQDAISLNKADVKWGIDGPFLVKRLRGLSTAQSAAIEVWAKEFWEGDYNNDEFTAHHLARVMP